MAMKIQTGDKALKRKSFKSIYCCRGNHVGCMVLLVCKGRELRLLHFVRTCYNFVDVDLML